MENGRRRGRRCAPIQPQHESARLGSRRDLYALRSSGTRGRTGSRGNGLARESRLGFGAPSQRHSAVGPRSAARFLKVPHQQITCVGGTFGDFPFQAASFRHVPSHCKFVALMPQWDFLSFLSDRAKSFPGFDLRMRHEAVDLLHDVGPNCRSEGAYARGRPADTGGSGNRL